MPNGAQSTQATAANGERRGPRFTLPSSPVSGLPSTFHNSAGIDFHQRMMYNFEKVVDIKNPLRHGRTHGRSLHLGSRPDSTAPPPLSMR